MSTPLFLHRRVMALACALLLAPHLAAQTYTFTQVGYAYAPGAVTIDAAGNLYAPLYYGHSITKITPTGTISTFAGTGTIGSADGNATSATFHYPRGIAIDATGNFYVADSGNRTIRKITPNGNVSTFAGSATATGAIDATGTAARFENPQGLAIDPTGNLFVADMGAHTIRKITPNGGVTTVAGTAYALGALDGTGAAARFASPQGLALDSSGNIFVADTSNHAIRKITPAGVVSTVAGYLGNSGYADGSGTAAQFNTPTALVIDPTGNIFVADSLNFTLRKITPAGVVTTIGGLAGNNSNIDGIGGAARFTFPRGLALDASGTLYIADNYAIKLGTPSSQLAITVQPQSASVAAGATYALTVTATGAGPIGYQWSKNGAPIAGATTATLAFPAVQASDSGTFSVTATGLFGSATSNNATLTIVAALPNNNFADAQVLTGLSGSATGRNNGATGEPGEPTHYNAAGTESSVWYRWTPTQSGTAIFEASPYVNAMAVYTGATLTALTRVSTSIGNRLTFTAVAGTTYSIALGAHSATNRGTFTLIWRTLVNDNFDNAEALDGDSGQISGTNLGATGEPGEPIHVPNSAGSSTSVWYRWTPTQSGIAVFDTIGSGFPTVMAVYTGSVLRSLVPITQDFNSGINGQSRLAFSVTNGTTYYIAVGSYYGDGGNIRLNWNLTQPPVIVTQPLIFSPRGSPRTSATSISVPVGTSVTMLNLRVVGETIQWRRNGIAIPGAIYPPLVLNNVQTSDSGTYTAVITNSAGSVTTNPLGLVVVTPPANDSFSNAAPLTGLSGSTTGTNVNAAGEFGEPIHWNLSGTASSVWYAWTPASSGLAVIDTVGSPIDTVLAVYSGPTTGTATLSNLTRLTQDDDRGGGRTSQVSFGATAGTTYFIALGGATAAARGSITLNWQLTPIVAIATPPASQTVAAGGSAVFSVTATGSGVTYQWYRNSTPIPGATNSTLAIGNVSAGTDASYTVSVTSSGGTVTSAPATLTVSAPLLTTFTLRNTRADAGMLWSVAGGAGALVACGDGGTILASTDNGRTWSPRASGNTAWLVAVTYGGGQFVIVGEGGRILTSPDGLTWTAVTATGTTERLNNILYADGKYVAIGEHGACVTSLDARVWTPRSTPVNTWLHGLAYHAGIKQFAAAGENGVFLYSPDAVTWNRLPVAGFSGHLHHIAAVDSYSHFVTVGDQGKVVSVRQNQLVLKGGESLTTWTAETSATSTTKTLIGLVQGAGALFAMSEDGKVFTAANDRGPWFALPAPTTGYLNAGIYHNNTLFIVGQFQTVIQSEPLYSSRLVNLSTRGQVGTGGDILISGFIVTGTTPKRMLVRAAGPALAGFGLTGQLTTPVLTLFDKNGKPFATNAGWGNAANSAAIASVGASVGAFPFSTGSADSALLVTLDPGSYTAQISGAGGATGLALVEAYDTESLSVETARAVNVSTRGLVGGGQGKMIAGFVIDGSAARRVLLRAVGPGLAAFGVPGTIAEPQLELYTSKGLPQGTANAWGLQTNADEIRSATKALAAFSLPDDSKDAAMLVTLLPGAWTVQVGGANNSTGVALVEVYVLP